MSMTTIAKRDVAKRSYGSVRIDESVLDDCRVAASLAGKPISDFISDVLRPFVKKAIKDQYEAKYGNEPK